MSYARIIVGFRNVLTHEYAAVDDEAVNGVATEDVEKLRRECAGLLSQLEATDESERRANRRSLRRCAICL